MKRVACISVVICIFLMGCSQKVQKENILAEFEGQVVTIDELEQELSELSEWEQRKYEGQEGRKEYLTLMAESRMLLQVAVDKRLDKDEEIVKQTRAHKDKLMVQELVKREVDDKINITDAVLNSYYEEHKADYTEPEKVIVTEITVKDEEKAKEMMEKIKSGADFTELAKEMDAKGESLGPGQGNEGKTRPFSQDSYSGAQEFVRTAFNLEVGRISDIIAQPMRDETYYMIVRADERIPARQQEFSEVESRIRRLVEKEKKKERMDQWLETLKAEKEFQLYPDRIPKIAEAEEEKAEEKVQEVEGAEEEIDEKAEKDEQGTSDEGQSE